MTDTTGGTVVADLGTNIHFAGTIVNPNDPADRYELVYDPGNNQPLTVLLDCASGGNSGCTLPTGVVSGTNTTYTVTADINALPSTGEGSADAVGNYGRIRLLIGTPVTRFGHTTLVAATDTYNGSLDNTLNAVVRGTTSIDAPTFSVPQIGTEGNPPGGADSFYGENITISAKVHSTSANAGTFSPSTGNVTFFYTGPGVTTPTSLGTTSAAPATAGCTGPADPNQCATYTLTPASPLPRADGLTSPGELTITAQFNGTTSNPSPLNTGNVGTGGGADPAGYAGPLFFQSSAASSSSPFINELAPTVIAAPTTSPTTSNVGAPFTLSTNVTRDTTNGGAGVNPSAGTVTFFDSVTNNSVCSTTTIGAGGLASCSFGAGLAAGTSTYYAKFADQFPSSNPSSVFLSSQSGNSATHTVAKNTPALTLYSTDANVANCASGTTTTCTWTYGTAVGFTAKLASNGATANAPTGNLTYQVDGGATNTVNWNTGTFDGAGNTTVNFTLANLIAGGSGHTITVSYAGDATYASPTQGSRNATVNTHPTTSTVSAPTSSVFGQSVTISAAIAASASPTFTATGTPATVGGTVNFYDGPTTGTPLNGSPVNVVNGAATFSTSTLGVGSHSFNIAYLGDSNYSTSSDTTAASLSIGKASTSTSISTSPNPSIVGGSVALTATVSINAPGGAGSSINNLGNGATVNFYDGATQIAGPVGGSCSGTTCTFTGAVTTLAVGSHTITATYSGNTSYTTSTTGTGAVQVINQDGVFASITSSTTPPGPTNTSTVGQTVTFTANIQCGVVGGTCTGGTPTGTVTFSDGTTVIKTVNLTALAGATQPTGTASVTDSTLTAGAHSISVLYNGDTNHPAGPTATLTETVNLAPTATALAVDNATTVYGQPVNLTATVTSANTGTISGTVTFTDGTTTLGTGTVGAGGVATLATGTLSVGTHLISASYGGDTSFAKSASTLPVTETVGKASDTLALTSSANPAQTGALVTITATLKGTAPSTGVPTGSVTFADGLNNVGTGTIGADGTASFSSALLANGPHTITASYTGDSSFGPSTATITQTISQNAAQLAVTAAPTSANAGDLVTITATLTGDGTHDVTGSVDFSAGGTSLGSGVVAAGVASVKTGLLPVGTDTVTAVYSGDTNYGTVTGSVTVTVAQGMPTVTVTSSANPSTVGANVTFTATLSSTSATGTVEFFDGTTSLGTSNVANGVATLSNSSLTAGSHSITATYSGDANNAKATSAALTQTVNAAGTSSSSSSSSSTGGTTSGGTDGGTTGTSGGTSGTTSGTVGADAGTTSSSSSGAVASSSSDDSGCNTTGNTSSGVATFLLAALSVVVARRRRRSN